MLAHDEQAAYQESVDNVRRTVERYLVSHMTKLSVIDFVSNLQHGVSRVFSAAIEQGVPVACKVGCSHCCHARVEATAPEIFRIARELESRPIDELSEIIQCLKANVASTIEPTAWSQRRACPFLTNNLCVVYDKRPKVCRSAHSLDVRKCETDAEEIPQDLGVVVRVKALTKGTSEGYKNLGFDSTAYELGAAVLLALTDASAEARWFSGEAVFLADKTE